MAFTIQEKFGNDRTDIASDIKIKAVYSVGIALIIIFFYIFYDSELAVWIRSRRITVSRYTVRHKPVFSFMGNNAFSMEIDQAFIAAILTVDRLFGKRHGDSF